MTTQQRNFLQSLGDFFCSLKLTLFLLISLAVLSIIGTIIPQGRLPEEYIAQIGPARMKIYTSIGFFDMYHSWWFILLLCLLTVNLISCSIKRLPHIWKIIAQPVTVLGSSLEKSLANIATIQTSGDQKVLKEEISLFLKNEFSEPIMSETDGDVHLFAQKMPWCRLSVYVVHLSVIVIFVGAIIGSIFGYKGYVNIPEGESVSRIMLRSEKELDLGFSLRLEQFTVAKYATGAPKEFKSILTVLENGKPVPDYTNARVIVNDPLTYKGITFYQSSYGNAGSYFFTVSSMDGKTTTPLTLDSNSSATLPDGSSMHVLEATDDVSQFIPQYSGPAAQVEIHTPQGASEKVVVFANFPELNIQHAKEHKNGLVLQYKGTQKKMYTGLQVAKDPGVWIVWVGCFLMVCSVYSAFFLSHRRIWVRIQDGAVTIGGNASKNQGAFQNTFDDLVAKLNNHLAKEKQQ